MPGPTAAQRRRQAELIKALSQTGWALPGTFTERYNRCGKANCRCKQDPPTLHGPYYQWTRKVDGKTVTRLLSTGTRSNATETGSTTPKEQDSYSPSSRRSP